jgi:hypothetical protein
MFGITFQSGGLTTGSWTEDPGPNSLLIGHGRFYPGAYRFDVMLTGAADLFMWKVAEARRQMQVQEDGPEYLVPDRRVRRLYSA